MKSRILLSCLALFLFTPLHATADGADESTVAELREALFQLHDNEIENLTWRLPNEDEVVPFEGVDFIHGGCRKPVPVRLQQPRRFVVRCETAIFLGFDTATITTNTLWTYTEGTWEPGHLYWVKITPTNRRLYEEKEIWEKTNSERLSPLVKQLTNVTDSTIKTLGDSLSEFDDLPLNIGSKLSHWNYLAWPEGLIAVGRDDRFLVQRGTLEGVGRLAAYANSEGTIPEYFRGVIRLDSTAGFIVSDFETGGSHIMLALAELKDTNWQQEHLVWENGQYGIQMVRIERDLGL